MFCKTEDPFTLLPQCFSLSSLPFDFSSSLPLSLWSIKESGIQTPTRWLFWGASLPSSPSACSPAKVSSLPQHLISWIHWPTVQWAERAWTQRSLAAYTSIVLQRVGHGWSKLSTHACTPLLNAQSSFFLKGNASGMWKQTVLKVKWEHETTRDFCFWFLFLIFIPIFDLCPLLLPNPFTIS